MIKIDNKINNNGLKIFPTNDRIETFYNVGQKTL